MTAGTIAARLGAGAVHPSYPSLGARARRSYNDYVFLFTGLVCAGGGEPCRVEGAEGICASGLTECGAAGALSCRMVNAPREERCDGADSDCDGEIDEGDGLCAGAEVCVAGRCVAPCFEGGCAAGETCSAERVCVETACLEVTCAAGERCLGGVCGDACAGVVCPGELACVAGRCADPCAGVECDDGVCERGVCVQSCDCRPCASGRECASSGACVPDGCADVACRADEVCRGGACVDACDGAVCPLGQVCEAGACRDASASDAGVAGRDGGGPPRDAGTGQDAGRMDAGGVDGGGTGGDTSGGCGCRVGASRRPFGLLGLLAAALLVRVRRRVRGAGRGPIAR